MSESSEVALAQNKNMSNEPQIPFQALPRRVEMLVRAALLAYKSLSSMSMWLVKLMAE
jgi:hypothetical protein